MRGRARPAAITRWLAGALALLWLIGMASPAQGAYRFAGAWGSEGSGSGQLDSPHDVAVAPSGQVYVADTQNNRIQRFSPTGVLRGAWGGFGNADGELISPVSIAVAPSGDVYVGDTGNGRVQRFGPGGAFRGKWGSPGGDVGSPGGDGEFFGTNGIAVAPSGQVYVADTFNNRVQRFGPTGAFLGKWGGEGSGDGQLDQAYDVAVDTLGDVYVADHMNNRVQRFGPTGAFRGKWATSSPAPWAITTDPGHPAAGRPPAGDVLVGHPFQVDRYGRAGAFRGSLGSFGRGDGEFSTARGIATNPSTGALYVADMGNHRIQRFRVAKRATLRAKPGRVARGKRTRLIARLFPCPHAGGDRIRFDQRRPGGGWRRVGARRNATGNRCQARTTVRVRTSTRFRARSLRSRDLTVAISKPVRVRVR